MKVFVSSTIEDLADHRTFVIDQIRKAGYEVDSMEHWTATSNEPSVVSQERLADCGVCVLIVALRRGHIPKNETLSITQLEYAEARRRDLKILVFMLEENAPWSHSFVELEKDPQLLPWRKALCDDHVVSFFKTQPDSIEIAPALALLTKEIADDRDDQLRSRVSWHELVDRGRLESENFVGQMSEQKYRRELFVPRDAIVSAFDRFFAHPRRRGFVLLGESGSGKTNTLCHLTEELLLERHLVATYDSKTFVQHDTEKRLTNTLVPGRDLGELLKEVDRLAAGQNRRAIFIFDAVNECVSQGQDERSMSPALLIERIDDLFVKPDLPHVRTIISCRNYTWKEFRNRRGHGLSPEAWFTTRDTATDRGSDQLDPIALTHFTHAEFDRAYPKYREKYKLQTTLAELNHDENRLLRHKLCDPFLLRLTAKCHEGGTIPKSIDSADLLWELYQALVTQRDVAVLVQLTKRLRSQNRDAIPLHELQALDATDPLRRLIFTSTNDLQPAVERLMDNGILRKREDRFHFPEIGFVYDRVHEFVLANLILDELRSRPTTNSAEFFETELASVRNSAVTWGAICMALNILFRNTNDPDILATMASSQAYGAPAAVVEVIEGLAQEDYSRAKVVVRRLLDAPPEALRASQRLGKIDTLIDDLGGASPRSH